MKQWLLSVNNHTYECDRKYVDTCIKIGKNAMKGKNAIIAVEKGNVIMLVNEQHNTIEALNKAKHEYINKGFKVYTT